MNEEKFIKSEIGTKNLFTNYGSWYNPKENILLQVSANGQHNPIMKEYLDNNGPPQKNNDARAWALRNGWIRFGTEVGEDDCTIQASITTLKTFWKTLFPRLMRAKFDGFHIETVGIKPQNVYFSIPIDLDDFRNLNLEKSYDNFDMNIITRQSRSTYANYANIN